MSQNKHKIPVSGYNPRTKELFFSWRSGESGGTDAPDRTLVLNLEFGHASYMDHGFTAMANYQSYSQMSLRDFMLETIISNHDVSICECDDSISDIMQGDPYVSGRTNDTTEYPSLWNAAENTGSCSLGGHTDKWNCEANSGTWTAASASSDSLCSKLGSMRFEHFCEDGTEGSTFVMASSEDKCLKQQEDDYYARDTYNGSSYVVTTYKSILESGALHFNTDDEKTLQRITLEYSDSRAAFNVTTCVTTSGSSTVTCVSNSSIKVGQTVTGNGVPTGATVSTVNSDGAVTSFTLSSAATATADPVTLSFSVPVEAEMKFGKSNQPDQLLSGASYKLLSGKEILDDQSSATTLSVLNNTISPDDKAYFNNITRGRYLGYQLRLSGHGPATLTRLTLSTRRSEK
tara:strand:+ start:5047 stop:6255 length:1209 start_codon:yes stop_codon:yes gene_type:complete